MPHRTDRGRCPRGQTKREIQHAEHRAGQIGERDHRATSLIRGASPLGLPYTLSRAPLRRRAPFAWLTRCRSLALPVFV